MTTRSTLRGAEQALKRLFAFLFRIIFRSNPYRNLAAFHPKAILVVRQHNQLGDMLCAVPLLRSLREKFPKAFISLITSPVNYDVMVGNEYIDEVLCYDKREFITQGLPRLERLLRFLRALRKMGFDLAIVPATVSTSSTSDWLAFLSGARVRIGPSSLESKENPTGFLFNVPVPLDWRETPEVHQAERNTAIALSLGIASIQPRSVISLKPSESKEAKSFLGTDSSTHRLDIVYHPGAGKIPNRWPADRFALVANILSYEFDARVVITSGQFDGDPVSDMKGKLSVEYKIISNEPIRKVAAVLSQVALVITNDTGIMHVGAAVGTPVLSLFGPTDWRQWAPIGHQHRVVASKSTNIEDIQTDEVLFVAREMLRTILQRKSSTS
ncbi:MAG TPA: glycosyltransferase family 9 protein [Bacteroidota bacterium]